MQLAWCAAMYSLSEAVCSCACLPYVRCYWCCSSLIHASLSLLPGVPPCVPDRSFGVLLAFLLTQQLSEKRGQWRLPCAPEECPQVCAPCGTACCSRSRQSLAGLVVVSAWLGCIRRKRACQDLSQMLHTNTNGVVLLLLPCRLWCSSSQSAPTLRPSSGPPQPKFCTACVKQ